MNVRRAICVCGLLLYAMIGVAMTEIDIGNCSSKRYTDAKRCDVADIVCTGDVEVPEAIEYAKRHLNKHGFPLLGSIRQSEIRKLGNEPFIGQWMSDQGLMTSACVRKSSYADVSFPFDVLKKQCAIGASSQGTVKGHSQLIVPQIGKFLEIEDGSTGSAIVLVGKWISGDKMYFSFRSDLSGSDSPLHLEFRGSDILINNREDSQWGQRIIRSDDKVKREQEFIFVLETLRTFVKIYTIDINGDRHGLHRFPWRLDWQKIKDQSKILHIEADSTRDRIALYSANLVRFKSMLTVGPGIRCYDLIPITILDTKLEKLDHPMPCKLTGRILYKEPIVKKFCSFARQARGRKTEIEREHYETMSTLAPRSLKLRCEDEQALDEAGTRTQVLECPCTGGQSLVRSCGHSVPYKEKNAECGPDPEFKDDNITKTELTKAACYCDVENKDFEDLSKNLCAMLYFYAPIKVSAQCADGIECGKDQIEYLCGEDLENCPLFVGIGPTSKRRQDTTGDSVTDDSPYVPNPRSWHPFKLSAELGTGKFASMEVHRVHSQANCNVCDKIDIAVAVKKSGASIASRLSVWCTKTIQTLAKGSWQEIEVELPLIDCTDQSSPIPWGFISYCPRFKVTVKVLVAYTKAAGIQQLKFNFRSHDLYDPKTWSANMHALLFSLKKDAMETQRGADAIFCDG